MRIPVHQTQKGRFVMHKPRLWVLCLLISLLATAAAGQVNLTDAVHVLMYLFQAGPEPALGTGCVKILGCPEACKS